MKGHDDFDDFAGDYDGTLNQALSVSGESKDYFARGRVVWLAERLRALGLSPRSAVDFGCGTGSAAPWLVNELGLESLLGLDISEKSIEVARKRFGSERIRFQTLDAHEPKADVDLAFCNGVFHHIPPRERAGAVSHVWRSLRPGGVWAFWDNNPYNPGTQWIIHRLPFERDSVTVSVWEAKRLLRAGRFEILTASHLFVFPRFLRWFRALEPRLARLPIGAQYLVLAQKPYDRVAGVQVGGTSASPSAVSR
ncbi:MAG TPA: class I SAM-dependent methyltransferase [Polyangiaceae bacterium]